jgi:hypothetical protein
LPWAPAVDDSVLFKEAPGGWAANFASCGLRFCLPAPASAGLPRDWLGLCLGAVLLAAGMTSSDFVKPDAEFAAGDSVSVPAFTIAGGADPSTDEASLWRFMYLNSGSIMTPQITIPSRIPRTNCSSAAVRCRARGTNPVSALSSRRTCPGKLMLSDCKLTASSKVAVSTDNAGPPERCE